jgi:hypothetical protein
MCVCLCVCVFVHTDLRVLGNVVEVINVRYIIPEQVHPNDMRDEDH